MNLISSLLAVSQILCHTEAVAHCLGIHTERKGLRKVQLEKGPAFGPPDFLRRGNVFRSPLRWDWFPSRLGALAVAAWDNLGAVKMFEEKNAP